MWPSHSLECEGLPVFSRTFESPSCWHLRLAVLPSWDPGKSQIDQGFLEEITSEEAEDWFWTPQKDSRVWCLFFLQEDGTSGAFLEICAGLWFTLLGNKIFPLQGKYVWRWFSIFPFSRGGISWFWRGDRKAIAIIIKFSFWMGEFNLGVNTKSGWLLL